MNTETAHTYTVKELITEVQASLKNQYPDEIWIEGMVQGYSVASSGHTYFNLIEKTEEPGAIPDYLLSVAFFKFAREKFPPEMEMENGLEVRIRGKAGLYSKRGNFQIVMSAIDAKYTTSKLAENKELLKAKLQKEGLLDLNKAQPLSILPLNIALITSKESAAHKDFEDELAKSGFSWKVKLIHTSVQGETASAEIRAALKEVSKIKVDVVALVRGGGSAIDLSAFDDELLARDIAKLKIPVFCGIGHEIDHCIVDLLVHTSAKTPTACARKLIDLVAATHNETLTCFNDILSSAKQVLATKKADLNQFIYRIAQAPTQKLQQANIFLSSARTSLALNATQVLKTHKRDLVELQTGIVAQSRKFLTDKKSKLDFIESQIKLLDPQKFLSKGWSITHTENGELVKDPKDIAADTVIVTQVSKGKIKSKTMKS